MSQTIKVQIMQHLPTQTFATRTGGEFSKAIMVTQSLGDYPVRIAFELQGQQRIEQIQAAAPVGSVVEIFYYLESREWQDRWYTSAICSGIKDNTQQVRQPQQQASMFSATQQQPQPQMAPSAIQQQPVPIQQQPYYTAPTTTISVNPDPDLPF